MTDLDARLPPPANAGLRVVARITDLSYRRRWLFLLVASILTAGSMVLASHLEIRSSFAELLPGDLASVANLKNLIRRVGGDGTVLLSLEVTDSGSKDLSKAQAWVPVLAGEIRGLGPEIRSVEENVREIETWYEDHWPLFVSVADLTKARDALAAEVHRRKAAANPLAFDLSLGLSSRGSFGESSGESSGESLGDPPTPTADLKALPPDVAPWLDEHQPLPREQIAQRFAEHEGGFYVHPDHRSVTILVRPAGTALGVSESRALLARIHELVNRHQPELTRDGLRVGLSGTFPQVVAEYTAILHDIASTAVLIIVLVLAVLLLFFREIRSVVALMAAMLVAVAVTFGLTRLAIGYLNTQTAFLGAIVVGNGINYGLIYLARVRQLRVAGASLRSALRDAALVAARATLLAAAASSVSFGVLAIAANRGFRHFGFIGGLGMLLCWAATFLLMPALLAAIERLWPETPKPRKAQIHLERRNAYPLLSLVFGRPRLVTKIMVGLAVAALVVFLVRLPQAMETNLGNLGSKLTDKANSQLVRDNQRAHDSIGRSIASSIALLPSPQAATAYCGEIDRRTKDPTIAKVIESCDTIGAVVPERQTEKLALIHDLASRLTDGLLATVPPAQAARLRAVRADLNAQQPLNVAAAPLTLTDRFRESDGTIGNMAVVTAKPDAKLEVSSNLIVFANAVRNVQVAGQHYDATGEDVILADLLDDIDREGPRTTLFSFLGVCALVLLFFRQWRRRLEVLASLLTGVLIMAGVATLLGIKINFFNFIVFPITFGIAVDYGANISARIRARGGEVFPAVWEVGPAVAVCSLTSIIGYFTLLFSINRALRSFGWYAITGEVAGIFTALVLLPALALGWDRWRPRADEAHFDEVAQ